MVDNWIFETIKINIDTIIIRLLPFLYLQSLKQSFFTNEVLHTKPQFGGIPGTSKRKTHVFGDILGPSSHKTQVFGDIPGISRRKTQVFGCIPGTSKHKHKYLGIYRVLVFIKHKYLGVYWVVAGLNTSIWGYTGY